MMLSPTPEYRLTQRESDIVRLAALGFSDREIASDLGIKFPTVRQHIVNIRTRMEARTFRQAIAISYGRGLISI